MRVVAGAPLGTRADRRALGGDARRRGLDVAALYDPRRVRGRHVARAVDGGVGTASGVRRAPGVDGRRAIDGGVFGRVVGDVRFGGDIYGYIRWARVDRDI